MKLTEYLTRIFINLILLNLLKVSLFLILCYYINLNTFFFILIVSLKLNMIHFLLNYFNFNLNYTNVLQLDYNFFIYCIHMQNSFFQHINYINEQQSITMFANYFLISSLLILLYFFYKELIVKNINNVFFINQIIPLVIIFTCIITPNNIFFISIFL